MGDVGNAGASAGAAAAGAVMNDHGSWLLAAYLPACDIDSDSGAWIGHTRRKWGRLEGGSTLWWEN